MIIKRILIEKKNLWCSLLRGDGLLLRIGRQKDRLLLLPIRCWRADRFDDQRLILLLFIRVQLNDLLLTCARPKGRRHRWHQTNDRCRLIRRWTYDRSQLLKPNTCWHNGEKLRWIRLCHTFLMKDDRSNGRCSCRIRRRIDKLNVRRCDGSNRCNEKSSIDRLEIRSWKINLLCVDGLKWIDEVTVAGVDFWIRNDALVVLFED